MKGLKRSKMKEILFSLLLFFILQVFIVAVLAIFSLVPKSLSNRAYRLSFLGTACSSVYYLYALYGRPKAWTLQAVQVYFQSIFTDARQYVIHFGKADPVLKTGPASMIQELDVSRSLTLSERAIAVALAISLDNDYFSRHGG